MAKLGWTDCDVVELDELTATALGIALNRTAELAERDDGVLTKLLDTLRAEDALRPHHEKRVRRVFGYYAVERGRLIKMLSRTRAAVRGDGDLERPLVLLREAA